MRIIRAGKLRIDAHLIQMCHFVKEGVRAGLEEAEGLTGLAPGLLATSRVALERFGIKGVFGAAVGEELGAEADHGCEGFGAGLGVGERKRVFAVAGFFAGDDELELEGVAAVAAGTGLDATVHEAGRFFVVGLEVILETSRTLVQSREGFCVWKGE